MQRSKNIYMPLNSNIPSIDLHGEDRKSAELLVKQFINDQVKLRADRIVIIHGIGTGILKKEVHKLLKNDKRIERYYIDFFNIGCTIVELKQNI